MVLEAQIDRSYLSKVNLNKEVEVVAVAVVESKEVMTVWLVKAVETKEVRIVMDMTHVIIIEKDIYKAIFGNFTVNFHILQMMYLIRR